MTTVSSPGKVLVAGGYLVLDPAYSGVVVSTSSRFYTTVRNIDEAELLARAHAARPIEIRVRSPQFLDATWSYIVTFDFDGVRIDQAAFNPSRNKFVHLALQRTLSLALEVLSAGALQNSLSYGIDITIVGDNDFYSQRAQLAACNLPPTLRSLAQLPPFSRTGVRLSDVHKTGLGSSAALITSLVASLLVHLNVIPRRAFAPTEGDTECAQTGRRLAHNLSQYIHCLAQGKVGSGFDVSAAVFGSQIYTRFDPAVLQPLMSDDVPLNQPLAEVISPANSAWNYRVEPFRLPPQTRMMLADVDAGSDTPSLVGKVLKWCKEDSARAGALWDALDKLNQSLAQTFVRITQLHDSDPAAYTTAVKYLSTLQSLQWLANPMITEDDQKFIDEFSKAHTISLEIREKMREMGTLSGVPIEPSEQTELLDACIGLAGIIGGGVPGAGGYDAIWLLVLDPENCPPAELPSGRVERAWAKWAKLDVSPLSATESIAMGVRLEDAAAVPGLQELVEAPW
ncbi:ribosomal protein S5 domain 2-type protein [Sparassis latifolia]|uniref:Phosphomevalonate kinase n=1 Tax=Sparassis crispa TaxID=139825 RepID=A0A401GFW7_9APHY|nr:Probable phosphomevalonate [Sparassis crispa]GBE81087.1 Probable phosphomevalonate [Sparassis crispa]